MFLIHLTLTLFALLIQVSFLWIHCLFHLINDSFYCSSFRWLQLISFWSLLTWRFFLSSWFITLMIPIIISKGGKWRNNSGHESRAFNLPLTRNLFRVWSLTLPFTFLINLFSIKSHPLNTLQICSRSIDYFLRSFIWLDTMTRKINIFCFLIQLIRTTISEIVVYPRSSRLDETNNSIQDFLRDNWPLVSDKNSQKAGKRRRERTVNYCRSFL